MESGEASYPKYNLNKQTVIYKTRGDLCRYEAACRLESQILTAIERRKYDYVADKLLPEADRGFRENWSEEHYEYDKSLPYFLRNMTAGHVYTRCLSHITGVLESLKRYDKAVEIFRLLIRQDIYCLHYRGKWMERLVIDLESHLKKPHEAYKVIEQGLEDKHVKFQFRLTLYNRGKKLHSKLRKKRSDIVEVDCPDMQFAKCPEKVIEAPTLHKPMAGRKTVFTATNAKGETSVLPVEEIALLYYKKRGFTDGLHTESQVYHVLLHLLLWDIVFDDKIEDAFRTPHQTLPLDFSTEQFYERRKDAIDKRMDQIRQLSDEQLTQELEDKWIEHIGTMCLINWNSVELKHIQEIAVCIGNRALTAICERLIKNFRFTRSGMPDLIVWNALEKTVKAVEVKGPGDSLSTKQILWLDYMNEWGLPAEVCYVKASLKGKQVNSD